MPAQFPITSVLTPAGFAGILLKLPERWQDVPYADIEFHFWGDVIFAACPYMQPLIHVNCDWKQINLNLGDTRMEHVPDSTKAVIRSAGQPENWRSNTQMPKLDEKLRAAIAAENAKPLGEIYIDYGCSGGDHTIASVHRGNGAIEEYICTAFRGSFLAANNREPNKTDYWEYLKNLPSKFSYVENPPMAMTVRHIGDQG